MWALGDKIASTIVAQTVGVPTLPWSGSGQLFLNRSGLDLLIHIIIIMLNCVRDLSFSTKHCVTNHLLSMLVFKVLPLIVHLRTLLMEKL